MPRTVMAELVVRLWRSSCCASAQCCMLHCSLVLALEHLVEHASAALDVIGGRLAALLLCRRVVWLPCGAESILMLDARWCCMTCGLLLEVGDVIPENLFVGCFHCEFEGGPCMYSLSSCRHFALRSCRLGWCYRCKNSLTTWLAHLWVQ